METGPRAWDLLPDRRCNTKIKSQRKSRSYGDSARTKKMPGNALLLAGEKLEPDLVNLKRWQQKKMQSKHEIDGGDKNPDAGSLTPDWHSFAGARFLHPGPAQRTREWQVHGPETGK
jgi:hypothetical protein